MFPKQVTLNRTPGGPQISSIGARLTREAFELLTAMCVGVYDAHGPRMLFGGSRVLPDLHGHLVCFTQSHKGSWLLRKPDNWLKQTV